ncbi:hypothetical protein PHYC_03851 [Phycisphaerales bacterium]|nr:hypothetical protein PHYC_03851 [Phycisphaerales bacterium]
MGAIFQRDGKWGIDYRDHRGRRVRKVVAVSKEMALITLGQELESVEKLKAGVLTADPREGKRPFSEHVDAYVADLQRRGRDDMYIYIARKHLEAAAEHQDWGCLADCSVRSASNYLRALAGRKLSGKTVNAHRSDLFAFFGWCVRSGSMEANPCEHVPKSADRREKTRRALSLVECRTLLRSASPGRRLTYLFLAYTGLRRSEASNVLWAHVHLDVANPYVELPAANTKSGRAESVPLVAELAEALAANRRNAEDRHRVFDSIPSMEEFREDLAAAGIAEQDERGRKVVLHSLRHSLATMLAASRVPPAVAQAIMRHRDIRLTLQAYTDEGLLPTAAAMSALPSLTTERDSLGFVGTTGAQNVPTSGLHRA